MFGCVEQVTLSMDEGSSFFRKDCYRGVFKCWSDVCGFYLRLSMFPFSVVTSRSVLCWSCLSIQSQTDKKTPQAHFTCFLSQSVLWVNTKTPSDMTIFFFFVFICLLLIFFFFNRRVPIISSTCTCVLSLRKLPYNSKFIACHKWRKQAHKWNANNLH